MTKSQNVFIYSVVAVMFFSAIALTALVFVGDSTDETSNTTDTTVDQTEDITTENGGVVGIVDGIDWPIVLSEPLTELVSEDLVVGEGTVVKENDVIVANYRLALGDGTPVAGNDTFASGSPFTAQLAVGSLIDGWVQGIPGMKIGGLRRLSVPAELAYGDSDNNGIPGGSDLVFDIEIVNIVQQ